MRGEQRQAVASRSGAQRLDHGRGLDVVVDGGHGLQIRRSAMGVHQGDAIGRLPAQAPNCARMKLAMSAALGLAGVDAKAFQALGKGEATRWGKRCRHAAWLAGGGSSCGKLDVSDDASALEQRSDAI